LSFPCHHDVNSFDDTHFRNDAVSVAEAVRGEAAPDATWNEPQEWPLLRLLLLGFHFSQSLSAQI